jgi:L-asparaginase
MAAPIVVLTTGGTIGSTFGSAGVVASAAGERAVTASLDDLDVPVEVQSIARFNSYAIQTGQMLAVAKAAVGCARRFEGVVVTHGTDTLEETAYLTDLLYGGRTPVVFTGAQRHADHPDSDGPRNLRSAVRLALDERLRDSGVLVAMDGRVDAARDVVKLHSHASRAFGGGEAGAVAELSPAGVRLLRRPPRYPVLRPASLGARVVLVKPGAGDDGYLVEAARQGGARGVVLEAFGLGNANPAVVDSVRSAVEFGIVVLVSTRCAAGGVAPVYGGGGAVDLEGAGAVLAGALSAVKARILLLAAVGASQSTHAAVAAVRRHL